MSDCEVGQQESKAEDPEGKEAELTETEGEGMEVEDPVLKEQEGKEVESEETEGGEGAEPAVRKEGAECEGKEVESEETEGGEGVEPGDPVRKEGVEHEGKEVGPEETEGVEPDDPVRKEGVEDDVPRRRSRVRSTLPSEGVELAMEGSGIAAIKPVTVGQMFRETCRKYPNRTALSIQEGENWIPVSYAQYYSHCKSAAKSFVKLGLEKFKGVAIIGGNSPEWFYVSLGCIFAGGLSVGIYTTNGVERVHAIASNCRANVVVVGDGEQLDKVLQIRDRLPDLKAIVQYKGKLSQQYDNVYDWEQFMELGKDVEDSVIERSIKTQRPDQCAILIYTSGTTGNSKGVMLSHDNLTWQCARIVSEDPRTWKSETPMRFISYLSLSHIGGQIVDIYLAIHIAAAVYFPQPDALKGGLSGQTMIDVKPTFLFAVPKVYEKFMEAMQCVVGEMSGLMKKLDSWATGIGYQGNINIQNNLPVPWGWSLANLLVLDKVKEKVGLSEMKTLITGGAPLSATVARYFMKYNMPIMESFGMTEATSSITGNRVDGRWRPGSVGKAPTGTILKLDRADEGGEGEICVYGRHVFMGYLNDEAKTRETIDDEGWLHTGDLGRIDGDGFLYVTGRIKDLIILSFGGQRLAHVSPSPIEDSIKATVPFLAHVVVIGEGRRYLTCLVTLKCPVDPGTGNPLDELQPHVLEEVAALGCELTKPSEIAQQKPENVLKYIQEGLDQANKKAISETQMVRRFTLLESDFSAQGGELGPTMKVKRRVVLDKYAAIIDAMYQEE